MRIKLSQRSAPINEPITPTFSDEILEKVFGPIEIIEHSSPSHLEGAFPAEGRSKLDNRYLTEMKFESNYTGMKFELVEKTEDYKEGKGYKWKIKVLHSGSGHLNKNSIVETWEKTLSEDCKILELGENGEDTTKRGRGRPRRDEVPAAPVLPSYEFPVVSAGKPWSHWGDVRTVKGSIQEFRVSPYNDNELRLLDASENILGKLTSTVLEDLGRRTKFPPEFVEKLSGRIAADVINECISKYTGPEVAWVIEDD